MNEKLKETILFYIEELEKIVHLNKSTSQSFEKMVETGKFISEEKIWFGNKITLLGENFYKKTKKKINYHRLKKI